MPGTGSPMASRWSVRAVTGTAAFKSWQHDWRAALAETATEQLFLGPEWVLPWCEFRGSPPRALVASCDGRVRAVAILVAERSGLPRVGPRVLRPPGLGVSDYLDLILPGDVEVARCAVGAIVDWLVATGGWDLLDL